MVRGSLADLDVFVAIAEEGSFTRAAARLGLSQSALSTAMRRLETRLGVRLLSRTTRSVSLTGAGAGFLARVTAGFREIDTGFCELGQLRNTPAGSLRITTTEHAAETLLWPALKRLLPAYPDISVETVIDYSLVDIVAERFDAGIRLGDQVAQDMIAVRIGSDFRMVVVASPHYLRGRDVPHVPQDLMHHRCVNLRLPTHGGLYVWEFVQDGQDVTIRVDGQVTFNRIDHVLQAALDGFGFAYVPEELAAEAIGDGRLVAVLDGCCTAFPGYHLFYSSRRQASSAFSLLVEALRYRGGQAVGGTSPDGATANGTGSTDRPGRIDQASRP